MSSDTEPHSQLAKSCFGRILCWWSKGTSTSKCKQFFVVVVLFVVVVYGFGGCFVLF